MEAMDEVVLARMEYEAVIAVLIAAKGQDHADSLRAKWKKAVLKHRQLDIGLEWHRPSEKAFTG